MDTLESAREIIQRTIVELEAVQRHDGEAASTDFVLRELRGLLDSDPADPREALEKALADAAAAIDRGLSALRTPGEAGGCETSFAEASDLENVESALTAARRIMTFSAMVVGLPPKAET